MEAVIAHLNQYHPISLKMSKRLLEVLVLKELPKGTQILFQKQACDQMYFVLKGFAKGVRLVNEKWVTNWFWQEGDLMTSFYSFIKQTPNDEGIEILEDTLVAQISYQDLQNLYQEELAFNIIGRLTLEENFLKTIEIMHYLRTKTALERYHYLLELYPNIFQRTTLANIASYLGVSQETISRIRSQR